MSRSCSTKKLQSRCEAAATTVGGSPPKVLARVLACCDRFWQLLDHEGGEMMKRLKEAEAAKSKAAAEDSANLNAMRAALAATMSPATPVSMDEDHALPHKPQAPRVRVERRGLLAGREQQPERMEPFVFGQSATPGASFVGRRRGGWFVSWTPRRPTLRHYSSGIRTEAVVRLSQWPAGSQNSRAVQPTLLTTS